VLSGFGASEHILERFSPQSVLELLQDREIHVFFPGCADHVFIICCSARQENEVRKAGQLRGCVFSAGCDHARDIEQGSSRAHFRHHVAGRLRPSPRPSDHGHGETGMTGTRIMGIVAGIPVPGPGGTDRRSDSRWKNLPFGAEGELIVRRSQPYAGLSQQARGRKNGLSSEKRAGTITGWTLAKSDPKRLSDDHRPHQGINHQGADRTSRPREIEEVAIRHHQVLDLRRGSAVPTRHAWARVPYLFVVAGKGMSLTLNRCWRTGRVSLFVL